MILRQQRNDLFNILQSLGFPLDGIEETRTNEAYYLATHLENDNYYFEVKVFGDYFDVIMRPGYNVSLSKVRLSKWQDVTAYFNAWVKALLAEEKAPDLWAEAAKTAQFFAPTSTPTDDKFTRTELAEVQGQLRLLQQSFTTAALPEAARQKLIELTQTAAVKVEGLTKKDWQNWLIGGFVSAIASLALNPTQASEVLKLVKAAFGGLFLH